MGSDPRVGATEPKALCAELQQQLVGLRQSQERTAVLRREIEALERRLRAIAGRPGF